MRHVFDSRQGRTKSRELHNNLAAENIGWGSHNSGAGQAEKIVQPQK